MRISEYAQSGVDYRLIRGFKKAMQEMGKRTFKFPMRHDVLVEEGGVLEYVGTAKTHRTKPLIEGLGNKNWIASWMERYAGDGRSYHEGIGTDTMRMATNDILTFRAMPVAYVDEVSAGKDAWFSESPQRMQDLVESYYRGCEEDGCALVQGESPAYKYLVNTLPDPPDFDEPAFHAPVFSGAVEGIIAPATRWSERPRVRVGDVVLGVTSSEWHCNGASLIIKRAMILPDKFLTKLPNGKTLGEQALTVTRSYVALVKALLDGDVEVHHIQPITGGGITKLAKYEIPYRYRIHTWVKEAPPVCQFMRELGVTAEDCYLTFNMGIGFAIVLPRQEMNHAVEIGTRAGYELLHIGEVEEGGGDVLLEHEKGLPLRPPDQ